MYGYGFGTVFNNDTGDYVWTNTQAETYYNALVTANGGDINSQSLYSITLNAFKSAIDTFFVTGNTNGWLADMIIMKMYIGGTAATHAINAINPGTFNTTFVNSPTHSASGTAYNGTTQYGRWGNNPSTDGTTLTSTSMISLVTNQTAAGGTSKVAIGSFNGATQHSYLFRLLTSDVWRWDAFDATSNATSASTVKDKVTIGSRIAANDSKIYIDGSSVASTALSGGNLPTFEDYEMAYNNAGSPAAFMDGTAQFNAKALGISSAKVTSLTTAIKNLQTTLNR